QAKQGATCCLGNRAGRSDVARRQHLKAPEPANGTHACRIGEWPVASPIYTSGNLQKGQSVMDAIVKNFPRIDDDAARPTQKEAEDAVRVLLRWAGDDPLREGLLDTPSRVAKSYREL